MVFLYDLTLPEILRRIISVLIYAGLQGGGLALILRLMGDTYPSESGRLSVNPFRHVLLSGIFLGIAFRTSWIAPMPFAPAHDRATRWRPLLAVIVSFAFLLACVPLLDLLRVPLHAVLPLTVGYMTLATIETLQITLVGAVMLSLLPLPGLLLGTTLPSIFPAIAKRYRKLAPIGMAFTAILLILGWLPDVRPLVKILRLV